MPKDDEVTAHAVHKQIAKKVLKIMEIKSNNKKTRNLKASFIRGH